MKNRMLPLLAALALLLIAGKGVYADPQFNFISPQKEATVGIFGSNADHFMSVRDYINLDFDRWMSVVSYRRQENPFRVESGGLAQLGFAARVGDLYIGASYAGNAWKQFGVTEFGFTNVYTEKTIKIPIGEDKWKEDTWKVYNTFPYFRTSVTHELRNEAAVLLGFAGMGLKLYYTSNYQSTNLSDFYVQSGADLGYYKSFSEEFGHINPGIVWGMTKDLIPGVGIKPQVGIDLDFNRDIRKREDIDPDTGAASGLFVDVSRNGNNNYFSPALNLSLGGVSLAQTDTFRFFADLDYGLKISLYDNEYSHRDADGKWQIKRFQGGKARGAPGTFLEISDMTHTLKPALKTRWTGERLSLAADLSVNLLLNSLSETEKALKEDSNDGSMEKSGNSDETTKFTIKPCLDLAMRWAVVPDKFFLSAGGSISFFQINTETIYRQIYVNDKKDETKDVTFEREEFINAYTILTIGASFNITPNFEIQANLGVDSTNSISVFEPNVTDRRALFGFANIMLTMQF